MGLTPAVRSLLLPFRSVVMVSTFINFLTLGTGWGLSCRRRYVTELIEFAGAVRDGDHSRYRRFFSDAARSIDDLYVSLAREAIRTFSPDGVIRLSGDEMLCHRRGLTSFGAEMQHDLLISIRKQPRVSWKHNWAIPSLQHCTLQS